jgi:hypothetical protein
MSDKIEDIETTVLPKDDFALIVEASKNGTCTLDGVAMSTDRLMAELAKHPEKGSPDWQRGLAVAGTAAAAGTVGFMPLIAMTGPLAPFAVAGLSAASYFLGANKICRMIIGNQTKGDLTKHDVYLDCGKQTGRPVYEAMDAESGRMAASKSDVIPGQMNWGDGFETCGIGMYRFEKNLDMVIGVYGTAGAISFVSSDPGVEKVFAVAWSVPEIGKPAVAVCENLKLFENLKDFFEKSMKKAGLKASAITKDKNGNPIAEIHAAISVANFPDASNEDDRVVTVTISPAVPAMAATAA